MSRTIAKYFIASALAFFIIGCLEGLMFPTKFQLQSFYTTVFHIPPEYLKAFFGYFVAKIHTHVNLIGWVGSTLMGMLYYLAPQISGAERYRPWAAYMNWACQTLGVIFLCLGFHLIGVFGLASGHTAGSPEFRSVAAPFKMVVTIGGVLITVSALLFTYNMVRTLFASVPALASAKGSLTPKIRQRIQAMAIVLATLALLNITVPVSPAIASPATAPQKADVIMIGDRLVDVAHGLGVVPAAMSVRCSLWPLCTSLKSAVQVLGCPNCLTKKKAAPLLKFARQNGIKRVLIEKSDPFCTYVPNLQLENMASFLGGQELEIAYVDFTRGLEPAVRQTAEILGLADKCDKVLTGYATEMEKTRKKMAEKQFVKKVVILRGTYQETTGKTFLLIESPGGYADRFLLKPMGIENVGGKVYTDGKKPSKGHVSVRKLDRLIAAAPDAIVMTGDSIAVQKALAEAIRKNPALGDVPAVKTHAVYSLPGYIDSSVIEYPLVLRRWADVLER
ncbi:hypothetical protein DSCO28_46440 [Desulfosarcina ovata subsp. sediminis]|uniref:Fe/B12 periplasmic-binding domain-containing protein n=1 Tax=Desulfosarcina ovata subsp. sediminis TaxID=885957 RepID=A0A5K7ZV52_9BACT|nr:ABC transporter substrate-binding protein [Desulfosarcina ovata]BBO84078.1 hypothetical protein DSCO28_46440 [Desulfosarcina ovata subsp. sediminis]